MHLQSAISFVQPQSEFENCICFTKSKQEKCAHVMYFCFFIFIIFCQFVSFRSLSLLLNADIYLSTQSSAFHTK